jgi:hypothetical protein
LQENIRTTYTDRRDSDSDMRHEHGGMVAPSGPNPTLRFAPY